MWDALSNPPLCKARQVNCASTWMHMYVHLCMHVQRPRDPPRESVLRNHSPWFSREGPSLAHNSPIRPGWLVSGAGSILSQQLHRWADKRSLPYLMLLCLFCNLNSEPCVCKARALPTPFVLFGLELWARLSDPSLSCHPTCAS